MTKEAIMERVRDELGDTGVTYYSTDDLKDSFDDGYEEICVNTGILERMGTLTPVNNQVYYNLYETFNDYMRVFAIWNPDINDWMSHKALNFFDRIRDDWEKASGPSYRFSAIDFQYISVYPHKSTVSGDDWEVFYYAVPPKPLELYETPEIPTQFQVVINYYMLADLLAQSEEYTKASDYTNDYFSKLEELRTYVYTRPFPLRINMLREQFSGGSWYGR